MALSDSFVAVGPANRSRGVLLGANSNRGANEAQAVVSIPHRTAASQEFTETTHLRIPTAHKRNGVVLSRPFWTWGGEMGVNESGVAITTSPLASGSEAESSAGLPGMDLVRLGLERADSAEEAVEVVTELLRQHGQGGRAGVGHDEQYDSGFIIADHAGAVVLETYGRDWALRKVPTRGWLAATVTESGGWGGDDAGARASANGPARAPGPPLADRLALALNQADDRETRVETLLEADFGRLDAQAAMTILRDHGASEPFDPSGRLRGRTICEHAGTGPLRRSQCTGSMVADLRPDGATAWFTSAAAPCTAVFFPVWLDAGLPGLGPAPTGSFDPRTWFWRHEQLHRATLEDYPTRHRLYAADLSEIQGRMLSEAEIVAERSSMARASYSAKCVSDIREAEAQWLKRMADLPTGRGPRLYRRTWRAWDREANRVTRPATGGG